MNSIRTGVAGVAIATIGLTIAAFAYTVAQGSTAGRHAAQAHQEGSLHRSPQAAAVEAKIVRTNLIHRLEAALGDDFGGAWFEPSTAQVHVGVTSSASRRLAEAVAARAGLFQSVTETPVDSTWAQLEAEQDRWNRRLGDLFERNAVTTWLSPQRNSVEVELSSSVSSAKRVALERAAVNAAVPVSIAVASSSRFGFSPETRCAAFSKNAALCDLPIVAGVTIRSPKEAEEAEEGEEEEEYEIEAGVEYVAEEGGKKPFNCSAGPAVVLKDPANKNDRTKTYVLTAGHCIDPKEGGGGVGKTWGAFDVKNGVPTGEHIIGPAAAYMNSGTDVGLIEVTTDYWAKDNDPIPVNPTIANWGAKASDPIPVTTRIAALVNTKACHSGQSTGLSCGEIVKTGVTLTGKKKLVLNEINEVKGGSYELGDSGGPWFAEEQYNEKIPTGFVEGVHIGKNLVTGNGIFHSLDTVLPELKKSSGYDLDLLTHENEIRHAMISAEKYPATISANDASSGDVFTAFGLSVKCTANEFDGVLSEPKPELFEVTPGYSNCTASGLPVKFTSNECKYKFTVTEKVTAAHYKAELGIVCPGGSPGIQFHTYVNEANQTSGNTMCQLTVPPQSGIKTVTLTNSGGKIVADTTTLEGVKVKIHRKLFLCPSGGTENETTSGSYQINEPLTFAGSSESKEVGIKIEGG
jgi:hypothetical protein